MEAKVGNRDALAELIVQSPDKARNIAAWAAVNERSAAAKLLEQAARAAHDGLRYTVECNGDLTYSRAGQELMLDIGRRLDMIDQSSKTIEQGCQPAAGKWGRRMQLSGIDRFIRQAVEVAA